MNIVKQVEISKNAELDKIFKELKERNAEFNNISKNLKELYDKIKRLRTKRVEAVKFLRANKSEREKLKIEIKALASKLKEYKQEKKEFGDVENPKTLKDQIKRIEWKIQTEVMPYDKEKELTKIKKGIEEKLKLALKKSLVHKNESSIRSKLASKVFEEQLKHENTIKYAKEVQNLKQEIAHISKMINKEKEKRKNIAEAINVLKRRIDELKTQLNETSKKYFIDNEQNKKGLKDKIREVKEKFSKSKKLTADDILILQSSPDEITL